MIKVRLVEKYPGFYWDSGTGVTIKKENREGIFVDENNVIIRNTINMGILEVVQETEEELNIIQDTPQKETIKEIVGPKVSKKNKETIKVLKQNES